MSEITAVTSTKSENKSGFTIEFTRVLENNLLNNLDAKIEPEEAAGVCITPEVSLEGFTMGFANSMKKNRG